MKFSRPIEFNPTSSNDFTFDEYALDVLAAPFRGLEGLGHGIYNLGDFVSFDVLPDWDEQRLLGRSKTTAGSLVEGITQFAIPFGAIGKGLSYAGKAARAGRATGVLGKAGKAMTKTGSGKFTDLNGLGYLSAGMASDFVAFDGQEQRLSNLIQQFPELRNPVTEFLAADEGDSELLGRTKNVLEGILIELGVGAVLKPFMAGLRAVKTRGREVAKGASKEDAVKSALLEYDQRVKDMLEYGDDMGATKDLPILPVGVARKELKKAEDELAELLEGPDWQGDIGGGVSPKAVELQEKVAAAEARVQEAKADRVRQAEPKNADEIIARIDELDDGVDVNVSFAGEDKLILQDAIDARPPRQPHKTNLEAKRGLEGSRGPAYLKRRLLKKFPIKGADEADAKDVTEFIETIGGRMFDDVSLSVVSNFSAAGRFDFASKLVTIRKQTIEAGQLSRTAIHELWHAASRYLPGADVKRLTSQFTKARKKFMADLSKKAKNEKLTHKQRLEAAKELSAFKKGDYTTANYRFSELDEFFTEEMTDAFFRHLDAKDALAAPGTIKRVAQEIAILLKDMFASMKSKLGIDQRQKIFNDFLKQRNVKKQRSGPLDWRTGKGTTKALPNLDETLNKIDARNVETGGVRAVRRTGAGRMKDPKTGEITSTIDGGLQQQELDGLLEAGSEKLIKEGKVGEQFTEGKANAIAVQEMADATGADKGTLEGLLNASAGDKIAQQRIAGRMLALRRFMGANGLDLIDFAGQYAKSVKDGQPDQLLEATIKSKMDMQLHIQARASELASGFGQGLRSTQFKAKVGLSPKEISNTKLRQEYLRRRGGMDINDIVNNIMMAKEGNGDDLFNTIIALNKTVRGANGGMFTKMVREYYINALLWGPRTMTVNFLGNGISSNIRQFERYIGGWLSADPQLRAGVVHSWSMGVFSKELWTFFSKAWKAGDSLLDNAGGAFKGDVGNEQAVGAITGENMGQAWDALRGTKGSLEGADTFKTAIDFIGKVVRIPSKFLVSTDELYKQLEFRRRAMAQLWMQAGERGLTNPEDIAKYVTESVEGLVTNSGRHFSEASLIKDASETADKLDFKDNVERERFMADHVEQARAEKLEFAREKGLVDNDEDLGALQQLSEKWVEPNLQSARNVTFTDELTDPVSQGIQKLFSKMPMGWIIMPFIKAPTNILKFSFGRALAPFRVGYEAAAGKVFPGLTANRDTFIKQLNSEDALVRAEARGKLATGVVMNTALLTTMFAFKDKITGGGPLDTRQKRIWEAAGNRPYSIKVGDTWVSYQRLDPIATMVGVAADMISVMDDSIHAYDAEIGEKALAAMMVTFARNVTNKSYLAGIDQFMKAMTQPEKSAEATLSRIAAGFVPNVLYQGQSLEGDQELKEIRSLGDAFYKKLPGLSGRLDLRRNILGEAYEAEMFEAGPSEVINPFNPVAFSTKTNDPILTEMANLHHGFSPPSHKLSRLVDLTQFTSSNGRSAYDRWLELHSEVKVRNKTLRQALQGLINSKRYRSLDPRSTPGLPSPRASLITRVLGDYRSKALKQMLQEFPEAKRMYDQASSAKTMSRRGASYDDVLSILQQ